MKYSRFDVQDEQRCSPNINKNQIIKKAYISVQRGLCRKKKLVKKVSTSEEK